VYPESLLVAMREGLTIISQKCPHLGCRVPDCQTSQWFECQCHGSQYNRVGEKKAGPAPRGMDRHPAAVSASGDVVIDTGTLVPGPPIGTNTTGQEAEGPHCTGGGEH
jgi:cytochrome b6-f complex iron-sulfur subunit